MIDLNSATIAFVEELKARGDVQGVVLFGSWARGNQRADSDVDLLVIVDEGSGRAVEYRDGQAFEVVYTTVQGAKDFYKTALDSAHRFWAVAKILFDRDGRIQELKKFVEELTSKGKEPLNRETQEHFSFDAQDQIRFARAAHAKGEVASANLILSSKVAALAEIYFDTIGEWRPAPKQLFDEIKKRNGELHKYFSMFYSDGINFEQKVATASDIIAVIFKSNR